MTTRPNPRLLDTRTIQRNIRHGLLTQTDYQQSLEELPDVAENILPTAEGGDDDGYEKKKVKLAPEPMGWSPSSSTLGQRRPLLYPSAPAVNSPIPTPHNPANQGFSSIEHKSPSPITTPSVSKEPASFLQEQDSSVIESEDALPESEPAEILGTEHQEEDKSTHRYAFSESPLEEALPIDESSSQ